MNKKHSPRQNNFFLYAKFLFNISSSASAKQHFGILIYVGKLNISCAASAAAAIARKGSTRLANF